MGAGALFTPAQAGRGLVLPNGGRAILGPSPCVVLARLGWSGQGCPAGNEEASGQTGAVGPWSEQPPCNGLWAGKRGSFQEWLQKPRGLIPRGPLAPKPQQRHYHPPDRREAGGASQGSFSGQSRPSSGLLPLRTQLGVHRARWALGSSPISAPSRLSPIFPPRKKPRQ